MHLPFGSVTLDVPEPGWYLDHVLSAAEPGNFGRLGPVRARQARWDLRAQQAKDAARTAEERAAVRVALRHGLVLTRGQAREAGLDEPALRRLVRAKRWHIPWRGTLSPLPPDNAVLKALQATGAALRRPRSAVSHPSACVLHGLPLLREPQAPTLTVEEARAFTGHRGVALHVARLPAGDTTEWFGAAVTTIARTVIDLARIEGRAAGLVAADAALAERLVTVEALERAVRDAVRRPGVTRAADVVRLADPLAESPLETLTRLCCHDAGLPRPELQARIETAAGVFRVDLLFRARRVVVEADGALKYRGDSNSLWREKRRQEALERAGYRVVRVTWSDVVHHPDETVHRIRAALGA